MSLACPHPCELAFPVQRRLAAVIRMKAQAPQPPKTPLFASTSPANASQLDSSRALTCTPTPRQLSLAPRRGHGTRLGECAGMLLQGLGDLVADRDRAAGEDVGSKAMRWTRGRSSPGRARFSRWARVLPRRLPTHSTDPTWNRLPTSAFSESPVVTMLRRASSQGELDLVEHFGFDEREFVTAAGPAERALALLRTDHRRALDLATPPRNRLVRVAPLPREQSGSR